MANFNEIVKIALKFEGGFQNFPNDSANWTGGKEGSGKLIGTNRGISTLAFKDAYKRDPSVAEMQNLTEEQAKDIYRKNYWNKISGDNIENQNLAYLIFDTFIASGYIGLIRIKKGLNDLIGNKVFPEDSTIFKLDQVAEINKLDPKKTFDYLKQKEIDFRNYLFEKNPSKYGKFIKGWLNRLNNITFEDIKTEVKKKSNLIGIVLLLTGIFFIIKKLNK